VIEKGGDRKGGEGGASIKIVTSHERKGGFLHCHDLRMLLRNRRSGKKNIEVMVSATGKRKKNIDYRPMSLKMYEKEKSKEQFIAPPLTKCREGRKESRVISVGKPEGGGKEAS